MFSLLCSFSSLMMWNSGRVPQMAPWVPFISAQEHYFYQAIWTVPWMVIAYLSIAGFIYLFTCLAGKEAYFEDSLMISAFSIAIPYLMFWWIPETFLLPAMGPGTALRWPELFEMERKFMFPGVWQFALVSFGMRKVNNTSRVACMAAGVFAVLAFFSLYLPYMR